MRPWPILLAGPLPAVLALSACAGTVPAPVAPEIPQPPAQAAPPPPAPKGPDMLSAQVLATIDDETTSPYFARRTEGALLLYLAKGRWHTRAIGADGAPKSSAPADVAGTGAEVSMAALRPVEDGFLAVWVELVEKNHVVKILSLDLDGKARGEPVTVSQVTDDLSWIDILPNASGALLVWEVPHEDRSDIFVTPCAGGKVKGAPVMAAHDVIGWEAEPTERGAALATVTPDASAAPVAARGRPRKAPLRGVESAGGGKGGTLGKVFLTEIDPQGKLGAPIVVSGDATALIDVTLAEVGGKYVIAWTDERTIDDCVYLAAVEPGGKIATPPHRATSPFGEQALVSLVAESYAPGAARSKRALLAWEDQLRATREGRLIHLATVGSDAQIGKERAGLIFSASGPPDMEPDGDGFVALTLAPVHDLPAGVPAQEQAPIWPAFVRFGADLTVTSSEPLRAEPFASNDGVPYVTRALTCGAGACTALGVGAVQPAKGSETPAVPAPIALFSLPSRPSPWKAPALRSGDEAPPRATSVTALFDGDHLAHVAAADLPGGGALAAWVTFVIDVSNPGGKRAKAEDAQGATLTVRPISASGAPGKAVVVSKKAVSQGGVSLAAAPAHDGKKPETAVAWVARERDEPQVFVTKLGPDGEKLAQKGVTVVSRRKGKDTSEAADVAIAYAGSDGGGGEGWITAWVDTRDGNAEIYAARVDRSLNKTVPDQRITNAAGDSVEVQIAVRGKDAFMVWSDARSNPDQGRGDVYIVKLDATTLKKAGPEVRLFASSAHSRTPQITSAGKGFVVSWIEDPEGKSGGEPSPQAGLRVALLDEGGALIGVPQLVRASEGQGAVTSAAIGCSASQCRGVLTASAGDAMTLGAFQLVPGASPSDVKTIAALTGATQDASPVFSGPGATSLFFADDAVGGTGRVRWMQVSWP